MTQSPRYRQCTPALWRGLCGMPLALRLNEGLGRIRDLLASSTSVLGLVMLQRLAPLETVLEMNLSTKGCHL